VTSLLMVFCLFAATIVASTPDQIPEDLRRGLQPQGETLTPDQRAYVADLIRSSQPRADHSESADPLGADKTLPVIDIWYGDQQSFGSPGRTQTWVNVLGTVSDPDTVETLTYSLNGGPLLPLSMGPDFRRLAEAGDFNIDLNIVDLIDGPNTVIIQATDKLANTSLDTVTVNSTSANTWPLPYGVDWDTVTNVQNVVQISDGDWAVQAGGLRTLQIDYDRVVGVGDVAWDDYEFTAPVTFHGIESPGPFSGTSGGFGFVTRWTGHTDTPVSGWQPKSGWLPSGAFCYYRVASTELQLDDLSDPNVQMNIGETWMFKIRVTSTPGAGGLTKAKVWEQGTPEPASWNLIKQRSAGDKTNGSIILYAHHTDVTLGDVLVEPVNITIGNVQAVLTDSTTALVTWTTDVPADSRVDYGLDAGYGLFETDSALVTEHSLILSNLSVGQTYHFSVTSVAADASQDQTGDQTFQTVPWNVESDDFNVCELDTDRWTFVNPLGDGSLELNGTQALISVPAGVEHRIWGYDAFNYFVDIPRIVQPADDVDFTLNLKFESPVTSNFHSQGIYFRQDDNDLMFVHFGYDVTNGTEISALKLVNGDGQDLGDWGVSVGSLGIEPLSMRIQRSGDDWTVWFSTNDGNDWILYKTFAHSMSLSEIGVYVSNSGNPAPAYTAVVDFVINAYDPILIEDPIVLQAPVLDPIGEQVLAEAAVLVVPVTATDADLDPLSLTATGLPSWAVFTDFGDGSGELTLSPLVGDGGAYPITILATDLCGLVDSEIVVVRVGSGIASDDFNACFLNELLWSFSDPLGTAELAMSGTEAVIRLPAGAAHTASGTGPGDFVSTLAVLTQPANDTDFTFEAMFDAPIDTTGRNVGLLIRQDTNDFIQLIAAADISGQPVLTALRFTGGARAVVAGPMTIAEATLPSIGWRIARSGVQWNMEVTFDGGTVWTPFDVFNTTITVTEVGIFVGNQGAPAPAHETRVDYIFDTLSPISPEDPLVLNAPVLSAIGDQFFSENDAVIVAIDASDADSEIPTLSVGALPAFASFTDFGNGTGQLALNPQLGDAGYYQVTVTATDACGLLDRESFALIVSSGVLADFVSDDFSSCELDLNLWTVVDPLGDTIIEKTGNQLSFTVPGGVAHDAWGTGPGDFANAFPRVTQTTADGDFTLETKIESGLSGRWSMAGVLINQDANDFLRLEFATDGSGFTEIVAYKIVNGAGSNFGDWGVPIGAENIQPLSMRIMRKGDQWTMSYSLDDGVSWTVYKVFNHALALSEISIYAGNSGNPAPATTVLFDFFMNMASPIVPEDGNTCSGPVVLTDLTALSMIAGDADGTRPVQLIWTPVTCTATVDLYRKGFGDYPEYVLGAEPVAPAIPGSDGWEFVASVGVHDGLYLDETTTRDQWYYAAFTRDTCGNVSTVSNRSSGVLNYLLGDVTDGVTPGEGNNLVDVGDILLLNSVYGLSDGEIGFDPVVDVGPTVDGSIEARPATDDTIDFEDLMIFATHYDGSNGPVSPATSEKRSGNSLLMVWNDYAALGDTFSVDVQLVADGTIQGLSVPIVWDTNVLSLVNADPGSLMASQTSSWWFVEPSVGIVDIALLGDDQPVLSGMGPLISLTFRVDQIGSPSLGFGVVVARDPSNQDVLVTTGVLDEITDVMPLPNVTALYANSPNPFNPSTTVAFDLARDGRVQVRIYDMRGSLVRTLADESLPAGRHTVRWNGRDQTGRVVASGTYLLRMSAEGLELRRRMMLLK